MQQQPGPGSAACGKRSYSDRSLMCMRPCPFFRRLHRVWQKNNGRSGETGSKLLPSSRMHFKVQVPPPLTTGAVLSVSDQQRQHHHARDLQHESGGGVWVGSEGDGQLLGRRSPCGDEVGNVYPSAFCHACAQEASDFFFFPVEKTHQLSSHQALEQDTQANE